MRVTLKTRRPPTAPKGAPKDLPPPTTRERILRAAADAWHANSFDGVGTAEICRLAKVHKGSFFHFFPSKDDLLLAVLDRRTQQIGVALREGPFRTDLPPLERFERFFAKMGQSMGDDVRRTGCMRGCPIGNIVLELATRSTPVQKAAARVFDEIQNVFLEALVDAVAAGTLPADTDTATTAAAVLVYMQGLAVLGKTYGDVAQMARVAAGVTTLLRDPPRRARARAARTRSR